MIPHVTRSLNGLFFTLLLSSDEFRNDRVFMTGILLHVGRELSRNGFNGFQKQMQTEAVYLQIVKFPVRLNGSPSSTSLSGMINPPKTNLFVADTLFMSEESHRAEPISDSIALPFTLITIFCGQSFDLYPSPIG